MPGQTSYPSVVDINKDTLYDIVSTCNPGGVWLWAGDGGALPVWTPLDTIVLGGVYMYKTAVGDFNQDGNPDIAATSWPGVYVWTGNGAYNPSWTARVRPITTGFFIAIDVADLNHDNISDIVAAPTGTDHLGVNVWLSDGNPSPAWIRQPAPGPDTTLRYRYLTIADVNEDGDMDIVAGHQNDQQGIKVWTGNGGTGGQVIFTPQASPALSGEYFQVAVGDVNNDSHPDIVGAHRNTGIDVWLGDGATNPNWTPVSGPSVSGNFNGVALGDLNLDGNLDIVATDLTTQTTAAWFGNGGPGGNFVWTLAPAFSPGGYYEGVNVTDVNRDSKPDVIASYVTGNRIQVWINDLTGANESKPMPAGKIGVCTPNPFSNKTTIDLVLTNDSDVSLKIFDQIGRLIRTTDGARLNAGHHALSWDGRDSEGRFARNGIYFLMIDVNGKITKKSAVLIR
jgi:hypothetical protein